MGLWSLIRHEFHNIGRWLFCVCQLENLLSGRHPPTSLHGLDISSLPRNGKAFYAASAPVLVRWLKDRASVQIFACGLLCKVFSVSLTLKEAIRLFIWLICKVRAPDPAHASEQPCAPSGMCHAMVPLPSACCLADKLQRGWMETLPEFGWTPTHVGGKPVFQVFVSQWLTQLYKPTWLLSARCCEGVGPAFL